MTIEAARNLGNTLWFGPLEKKIFLLLLQDAAGADVYLAHLHRVSLALLG